VFTRTTILRADPAKIDEGVAHVRDHVLPAVTAMEGCAGMSLLMDRQSGRCIVATAWESEAAMRDSAEAVRPLRESSERAFGSSGSDVGMWEVAVVHREHHVPEGACARVTWLREADDVGDTFRMAVLPRMQELDGFCSASLLIDRDTRRAVGTFIYDSREHLEASRDAAAAIRERTVQETGAMVDEVAELDGAFAHLHVPEMA
jgi:quinol monooxygenase YgiN